MGKGKGKRRRQANYLAAHGGDHKLPAPPTATDDAAVPWKLRRIMTLKESSSSPHNPTSNLSLSWGKSGSRIKSESKDLHIRKGIVEKQHRIVKTEKLEDTSRQARDVEKGHENSAVPSNESLAPKRKKRKREEDLQVLMDKFKATPIHKGLNDHKKRYLQEKKNKKKKSGHFNSVEANPSLHQQERIGFGDIVVAPPRLSFPKKDTKISEERLRQQAVETYRQKKKWLSRPGSHQPPPLANVNMLSL